jgi:hypothetical protein
VKAAFFDDVVGVVENPTTDYADYADHTDYINREKHGRFLSAGLPLTVRARQAQAEHQLAFRPKFIYATLHGALLQQRGADGG